GVVVSAVGGFASEIAAMAGLRLPIVTHPLQAYVTNHYEQSFPFIIGSVEIPFYLSQTPRGEILIGAEYERAPATRGAPLSTCSPRARRRRLPTCRSSPACGSSANGPGCATSPPTRRRSWDSPRSRTSSSRPAGAPGGSRRSPPPVSRWPN